MRNEIDTHTHTLASGHAYNTMNELAKAAADKGLKGLAITEHAPDMPGPVIYTIFNLRIVPRKRFGIELLLGTQLNIMNAEVKWIFLKMYLRHLISQLQVFIFHVSETKEL